MQEDLEREQKLREIRRGQIIAIQNRMREDAARGYAYMTIKDYARNVGDLPDGMKIAVPGQFLNLGVLSDRTKLIHANLVIDDATPAARQTFLACLKRAPFGAPCPVVVLGEIHRCAKTTFGIEDGTVPCIIVDDAWALLDIASIWSGNEVWSLSPIEDQIIAK